MSFNDRQFIKSLGDQVRTANPNAPMFFGRGILVMHANEAFTNMTTDSVVVHYDGNKLHAGLENNGAPVEGGQLSTAVDEASLTEFREKLEKLIGFNFTG
jgi:hypothetical protein